MSRRFTIILVSFMMLLAQSCKEKDNPSPGIKTKGEILINNPWRLVSITDASGKAIPQNQLSIETMAIYFFDIQFFDNNVTKALDRVSRQVVNGGTWYLIDNEQTLDIEVSQFKGKFGIKELSRSKLTLTNNVPVNGVSQSANLVFEPVIR
jgi:hypothetical protein